ncbi:MAG: GntR family transcriptional regulator, partial [Chitinivibrionales bacterium]|nr:GntR family transcriptional regulator [Chitinivibrionales bacterium]
MTTRGLAYTRAIRYLERLIHELCESGDDRLPTVAAMGRAAGVAKGTMHRAVRAFVDRGILAARQCAGITLADPSAPGADTSVRPSAGTLDNGYTHKADWLVDTIQRDLLNGAYAPGATLPRVKQLCARYGVGFRTLKAALGEL